MSQIVFRVGPAHLKKWSEPEAVVEGDAETWPCKACGGTEWALFRQPSPRATVWGARCVRCGRTRCVRCGRTRRGPGTRPL